MDENPGILMDPIDLPINDLVRDYSVAVNIVDSAVTTYSRLWDLIKTCQRHIAGEKPIPPAELKAKGMAWAHNFNYGKARAKIEKGVAENCAKSASAIALGYVEFRDFDKDADKGLLSFLEDPNARGTISALTGYCLSSAVLKEARLSNYLNEIEYPSYTFGYCAAQFAPTDWMPTILHPLNIAFPPNTKPDEVSRWVTFSTLTPEELYRFWAFARNQKTKVKKEGGEFVRYATSGWNPDALEEVLLQAWRGKINGVEYSSWADVLPVYRENPSQVISETDSVHIAKLYIKELDNTLSEIYIPYNNPWQKENKSTQPQEVQAGCSEILFKKNLGKFKQRENIVIIRDSGFSETGFIEDYRGIAKFAVEDSIRYNRIRNSIGDKSTFAGAPIFNSPTGQVSEKFKLVVMKPWIILPPGYDLLERQPNFDISSQIGMLRFEEGEYNRDTQQYDPSIEGRLTSRPNRGEVQRVTQEVEVTANAKNGVKFRDYSHLFFSILKRMHKVQTQESDPGHEGRERFYRLMKKHLNSYGVKTNEDVNKILDAVDCYTIEPVVSNIETITIAIQMAETPFARNRFKRMLLIAKGLPIEEVNINTPLIADKFAAIQDDRIAAFENDNFFTTNEILIAPTDDHITHLDSHIGKANRVIQGVSEGRLAPRNAVAFLANCLPHCVMHVEILGADPILNDRAKEYFEQIKELDKQQKQLYAVAQQQAREEAEAVSQPQIDPKTQNEIASKNAKAVTDIQRKDNLAAVRSEQRNREIENRHEERMHELDLKFSAESQARSAL